jgi:hypothetical protein
MMQYRVRRTEGHLWFQCVVVLFNCTPFSMTLNHSSIYCVNVVNLSREIVVVHIEHNETFDVDAAVNIRTLAFIDPKHILVEVHITLRNLIGRTNSLQQLTTAPLTKLILSLAGQKKKVHQFLKLACSSHLHKRTILEAVEKYS